MKKIFLRHTHLLLLFIPIYYQHHILQWQHIGQGCQIIHFYFNSLRLVYSLLGSEDRNRTLHAQLTPLSDVPYAEQGRISQLPPQCESKHYYFYQNKCKHLVFLFTSRNLSLQNSHTYSELLYLHGYKTGHP